LPFVALTRVRQAGLEAESDQWLLPNPSGQMPFLERAAGGREVDLDLSMSNGKFALMDLDDQRWLFGGHIRAAKRLQCQRLLALSSHKREWRVSAQADVREGAPERPALGRVLPRCSDQWQVAA